MSKSYLDNKTISRGGRSSGATYATLLDLQEENQQLKEQVECLLSQKKDFEYIQGKTIDDMRRLNKKLKQSEFVIEEILNSAYFNDDCPYSFIDDSWLQELCDCDNCQDTYKECWLKYFKNKCKGDNNENNRI